MATLSLPRRDSIWSWPLPISPPAGRPLSGFLRNFSEPGKREAKAITGAATFSSTFFHGLLVCNRSFVRDTQ
jgi:hypothetical protein